MIVVGKAYYFFTHAYHHILGKVVEITGKRECALETASRIQGCSRGWTEFWRDGCKDDTNLTYWPDGTVVCGWFLAVPWNHPLPRPSNDNPRQLR